MHRSRHDRAFAATLCNIVREVRSLTVVNKPRHFITRSRCRCIAILCDKIISVYHTGKEQTDLWMESLRIVNALVPTCHEISDRAEIYTSHFIVERCKRVNYLLFLEATLPIRLAGSTVASAIGQRGKASKI